MGFCLYVGLESPEERKSSRELLLGFGLVSCVTCLIVFVSFFITFHKNRDSFSNNLSSMIAFLTLSDFCLSLITMSESSEYFCTTERLCSFRKITSQFFTLCSYTWTASVCYSSYYTVSKFYHPWDTSTSSTNNNVSIRNQMLRFHLFSWGLPFLITAGTSLIEYFLSHQSMCATRFYSSPSMEQTAASETSQLFFWTLFACFFIPIYFVQGFLIYVYQYISRAISRFPVMSDAITRLKRSFECALYSLSSFFVIF